MKKIKLLLLLILLISILSACSLVPETMGEDLLVAPVLNQVQREIYKALEATLDTKNVAYKYPVSGEHRSPFVIYDMNLDGNDEVIVFYSFTDNPNEVFAKILKKDNDVWRDFYQISLNSSNVDFVEFAPLFAPSQSCLMIGWTNEAGESNIGIYSMHEENIVVELEGLFSSHTVTDLDNDGIKELLLVEKVQESLMLNYFTVKDEMLVKKQSLPLYEETTGITQTIVGKLADNSKALYIDEEMRGVSISYGTEVFKLTKDGISVIAGGVAGKKPVSESNQWQEYTKTFRYKELPSADIKKDGTIMVPRLSEYTDSTIYGEEENPNILTEYMQLVNSSFETSLTAAINKDAGYMVVYPEKWLGQVVIVEQKQRQEWRFHYSDPTTGDISTELFRIRVYRSGDFIDEFAKDDIELGAQGAFTYYGTIPQTGNHFLAITAEDAKEMFLLI